jgi:hypothetical protein
MSTQNISAVSQSACPLHDVVLSLQLPHVSPHAEKALNLLALLPPAAFMQSGGKWTSRFCGCTCEQGDRNDIRDFVRDVDGTLRTSGSIQNDTENGRR